MWLKYQLKTQLPDGGFAHYNAIINTAKIDSITINETYKEVIIETSCRFFTIKSNHYLDIYNALSECFLENKTTHLIGIGPIVLSKNTTHD